MFELSELTNDSGCFTHWTFPEGEFIFRFLPDADETNSFFWRMKKKDGPLIEWNGKMIPRPIRSYYMQGLVLQAPGLITDHRIWKLIFGQGVLNHIKGQGEREVEDDDGNITIIPASGLVDPRMEDFPVAYDTGYDFKLVKSSVEIEGKKYIKYDGEWLYPSRSLSVAERAAIEAQGLNDLKTWIQP